MKMVFLLGFFSAFSARLIFPRPALVMGGRHDGVLPPVRRNPLNAAKAFATHQGKATAG